MDEEGDVDRVLEVRLVVAGVVVGGGEADGGLLDGKDAVGLEREAYVRADLQHVVRVQRETDVEPIVDEPVAK